MRLNKANFLNLSVLSMSLFVQFAISEVNRGECGTVDLLDPRITGGVQTQKGQWPFLAALYYVEELKFFCGGTLITEKHVLTAAHCVRNKDSSLKLLPNDVLVLLGAYNLSAKAEKSVIQSEVYEIHVHPDWKVYSDNYDADLAIFILSKSVTFTNYIRPVCLPADDVNFDGATGSIVGWGLADNGKHANLEFPRHALTQALNASYCLTMDPYLAFLSSTRTFCGTGGDGSPNKGDSGGAFFVLSGSRWVQFGIISAVRINATGLVDANSIAIYTNVKLFKNWIDEVVGQPRDMVMKVNEEVKKNINLDCYADYTYYFGYYCEVPDLDIRSDHLKVASFTVFHKSRKTNPDIERIVFFNGTMTYLPNGIGKAFTNLKKLVVNGNMGFKHPKRSSLKNVKQLTHLHFYQNDVEVLDEDTLWDLPNLEIFALYKNKLKVLFDKTFEKNKKLKEVDFRWNQLELLPGNLFKENMLLKEVYFTGNTLKVIQIDFSELKNIRLLFLNDNVCINEVYDANVNDLSILIHLIRSDCSSVDS